MQLAVQTMGEYEVICAELIDDLCIPFVPVFSKLSGYYGFVILICEMPALLSLLSQRLRQLDFYPRPTWVDKPAPVPKQL